MKQTYTNNVKVEDNFSSGSSFNEDDPRLQDVEDSESDEDN